MPGEVIQKTWTLRNDHSKQSWPDNTGIMLVSKTNDFKMGTTSSDCILPLTTEKPVGPGDEHDVSLPLIAPILSGSYEAHFRLVDRDTGRRLGQRFPIIAEVVGACAMESEQ
jgi:hypothetical protein